MKQGWRRNLTLTDNSSAFLTSTRPCVLMARAQSSYLFLASSSELSFECLSWTSESLCWALGHANKQRGTQKQHKDTIPWMELHFMPAGMVSVFAYSTEQFVVWIILLRFIVVNGGESFDDVPHEKRQLGIRLKYPLRAQEAYYSYRCYPRPYKRYFPYIQPCYRYRVSTIVLKPATFGRQRVYRIYATPSLILQSSGSVGLSLVMWILGSLIAASGTAVFIELGTVDTLLSFAPVLLTSMETRGCQGVVERRTTSSSSFESLNSSWATFMRYSPFSL